MICWVDLETTGLNPAQDCILEMAIVLTDDDLNSLGESHFLITPRQSALDRMDALVRGMHTENGLLDDLTKFDTVSPIVASTTALRQLASWGASAGEPGLGGSSVHFDRSMLKMHMPALEAFFHYRNDDVSTIKRAIARWCPAWAPPSVVSAHRAQADIHDSIAQMRWYKDHFFTKGEPPW